MGRSNTGSTSNWLESTSGLQVTSFPLTISFWINLRSTAAVYDCVYLGNDGASSYIVVYANTTNGSSVTAGRFTLEAILGAGGATLDVAATGAAKANEWAHVCAVIGATTDLRIYYNGGGKGTLSGSGGAVGATELDVLGFRSGSSTFGSVNGVIAELAIFDAALVDGEVAMLAAGGLPWQVRPANLRGYWFPQWESNNAGKAFDHNPVRPRKWDLTINGTCPLDLHPTQIQVPPEPKRRYWLVGTAGGGGSSFTPTLADAPQTSDSVARALVLARTLADSPQTADAVTRAQVLLRSCADSPATADSLARAGVFARTASDAPHTTDALARAGVFARTAADGPATADSPVRVLVLPRTLADGPSTADALARSATLARTTADSPHTADSLARALAFLRTASDAPQTSDGLVRAATLARTAADAPTTSDAITQVSGKVPILADSPHTTDSLARAGTFARTVADAPHTSDTLTRSTTLARTLADAPHTGDSLARTQTLNRTPADSPFTSDSLVRAAAFGRTANDGPQTADSVSAATSGGSTLFRRTLRAGSRQAGW